MTTTPNGDKPMSTKTEAVMVPVAWLTSGGDVTRSRVYAIEQSSNDPENYPVALYAARPATAAPVGVGDAIEQVVRLSEDKLTDRMERINNAATYALASLRSPEPGGGFSGIINSAVDDLTLPPHWYEGRTARDIEALQAAFQLGVEVSADAILDALLPASPSEEG